MLTRECCCDLKGERDMDLCFWFCIVLIDGRVREREEEDEG